MTPTAPAISPFAEIVFADWVNHLCSLLDNTQLLALLNVGKPQLEMLVDALINAACRLGVDAAFIRILLGGWGVARTGRKRQISEALAILGDFIA